MYSIDINPKIIDPPLILRTLCQPNHLAKSSFALTSRSIEQKTTTARSHQLFNRHFTDVSFSGVSQIDSKYPFTKDSVGIRIADRSAARLPSKLSVISYTAFQFKILRYIEAEITRQIGNTLFPPNSDASKIVILKTERRSLAKHILRQIPVGLLSSHLQETIRNVVYGALAFVFPNASISSQILDDFDLQLRSLSSLQQRVFVDVLLTTLDQNFKATETWTLAAIRTYSIALKQIAATFPKDTADILLGIIFVPELLKYTVALTKEEVLGVIGERLNLAACLLTKLTESNWIPDGQLNEEHFICLRAAVSLMAAKGCYSAHRMATYIKNVFPLILEPFASPIAMRQFKKGVTFAFGHFGHMALDYTFSAKSKRHLRVIMNDIKKKLIPVLEFLHSQDGTTFFRKHHLPKFELHPEFEMVLDSEIFQELRDLIDNANALYYFKCPPADLKTGIELLGLVQPLHLRFQQIRFMVSAFPAERNRDYNEDELVLLALVNKQLSIIHAGLFQRIRNEVGIVAEVVNQPDYQLINGVPADILSQLATLGVIQYTLYINRLYLEKVNVEEIQQCFVQVSNIVNSIEEAIRAVETQGQRSGSQFSASVILPALERILAFAKNLIR